MPAGLTVLSEHNTIQIDDRYETWGLSRKYTVAVGETWQGSRTAISAIRGTIENTSVNYGPVGQEHGFDVYEFEKGAGSSDRSGLEVFDANGSTIFHSNGKPLRVVDFIRQSTANISSPDIMRIEKTYGGVGKIGVVVCRYVPIYIPTGYNSMANVIIPSFLINRNYLEIAYQQKLSNLSRDDAQFIDTYFDYMIVDLTNY